MPKKEAGKIDARKLRHRDVPASVGLVKEVRDELRADNRACAADLRGRIDSAESKLGSRIDGLGQRLVKVEVGLEQVLVSVHRTQVLMEEQRGENRIVLDGLKNVHDRLDRIEGLV